MKHKHSVFEAVCKMDNLYHAWHKVSLGKSSKSSILDFYRNLDENLVSIADDLKNGSYKPGPYNHFLIKDPKERIISASPVRDRVVQHAFMNYYDRIFDRNLIFDSYACRVGKGTHKAVLRAFHFAKSAKYFLKMDVKKYFDSIDHAALKSLLTKIIKDKAVLNIFYIIIDSGDIFLNKGLPIGNLTSQFFANYYLSGFDHYCKEQRHVRRYIRYMDDVLIFSDNKSDLKNLYADAVSYTGAKLKLLLKPPVLGSVINGAPFLGFLIKPSGIYLQKKSKKRYKARISEIEYKRKRGIFTELEAVRRTESVTSHLLLARSRSFRNTVLRGRVLGV
ncbi:MAG: RNA-directed DNA polymerase [Spirochaetes bacterium]|nr:RNA-directed DNA polymerase [Spirochaetota bacterium]